MRKAIATITAVIAVSVSAAMSQTTNYTADRTTAEGIEVIRLTDAAHKIEVLVAPSFGNNAYRMTANGKP
ncbi:MAG: hypothetical protein GY953_32840, partial [bacterium]|nr:hypothetical protein [bacterium]